MKLAKKNSGFTLIEILVVIGIIAVLATIVIIAINPARQFAQARDSQRVSNVNSILNGIGQRIADNKGVFEGTFSVGSTNYTCPNITTSGSNALSTSTQYSIWKNSGGPSQSIDLSCLVPTYIPSFPTDPRTSSGDDTGYTLSVDDGNRITISAPGAEVNTPISVTR